MADEPIPYKHSYLIRFEIQGSEIMSICYKLLQIHFFLHQNISKKNVVILTLYADCVIHAIHFKNPNVNYFSK
jgi:hypothetical protein